MSVAMGGYEEHLWFMLFLDNYVQKRETSFFKEIFFQIRENMCEI